jgi:hypothetical protein
MPPAALHGIRFSQPRDASEGLLNDGQQTQAEWAGGPPSSEAGLTKLRPNIAAADLSSTLDVIHLLAGRSVGMKVALCCHGYSCLPEIHLAASVREIPSIL